MRLSIVTSALVAALVGFGSTTGYDATLNGKVLDLALREAVNNLVGALDAGKWAAQGTRQQ